MPRLGPRLKKFSALVLPSLGRRHAGGHHACPPAQNVSARRASSTTSEPRRGRCLAAAKLLNERNEQPILPARNPSAPGRKGRQAEEVLPQGHRPSVVFPPPSFQDVSLRVRRHRWFVGRVRIRQLAVDHDRPAHARSFANPAHARASRRPELRAICSESTAVASLGVGSAGLFRRTRPGREGLFSLSTRSGFNTAEQRALVVRGAPRLIFLATFFAFLHDALPSSPSALVGAFDGLPGVFSFFEDFLGHGGNPFSTENQAQDERFEME